MEEDRSSKFSPSKLDVYKNCPRRYQYRYVDRIARERKTPETTLGVAVHAAFEELYELVRGGRVPSLDEVKAVFSREFETGWDDAMVLKDARFKKEDWKAVGFDCVERYYAAHQPFKADQTLAVEKRVGFPVEAEGKEYRIEGFVDRLSIAPDGAIEIHDYKTSKSVPSQEHADQDWQLALYELAIRKEWPDTKDVRLKWHYVRHGKTLTSIRDEAGREKLKGEVSGLISRIKLDHEFRPKKSALCDWCEYRDLCPEFAHLEKTAALPPEERRQDDGVKLVAELAELEAKRRVLKDELKALDLEKSALDCRIADWAQERGVAAIAGEDAQASVSIKEGVQFPTKTAEPQRHAALEKELRGTPLWDEVSKLDAHALAEGVKARRWKGDLLELAESILQRYGTEVTTRTVRLRRRRAEED